MTSKIENTLLSPFELISQKPYTKAPAEPLPPESALITKPTLSLNPMFRYLKVNAAATKVAENVMEYNMNEVEEHRSMLEHLRADQVERLQESIKAQDFNGFFSILAKIGSVILTALSAITGIVLIGSGGGVLVTAVGATIVAAALLSGANLLLEESGGWDFILSKLIQDNDALRRKVRVFLPAAIGTLSGALGIAGMISGWGALNTAGRALTIIQTAANFAAAITMASKGIHSAQVASTDAEYTRISHELSKNEELLNELINRFMVPQKYISRELQNASRIITLQSR
ncbi:MAG: hypothetical protein V4494_02505 [Chlamydiota bacterium]